MDNNSIKSFRDLYVYQNLYKAMIIVHTKIVPKLPKDEKFDLADQMKRASKGAPSIIAEGFPKRFLQKQWQKYINDTIGEADEMIHHLSVCIDVYPQYVDVGLCKSAIDTYDLCCRQLTKLGESWANYHRRNKIAENELRKTLTTKHQSPH